MAGDAEFREVGGVEPFDYDFGNPPTFGGATFDMQLDDDAVIKHIFWEDQEGNVVGLIASPAGLSIAIHEAGEDVGKGVSLRGDTVPDLTKFLLECAAQFGKVWRATSEAERETGRGQGT